MTQTATEHDGAGASGRVGAPVDIRHHTIVRIPSRKENH
jgi:hypothetical protein